MCTGRNRHSVSPEKASMAAAVYQDATKIGGARLVLTYTGSHFVSGEKLVDEIWSTGMPCFPGTWINNKIIITIAQYTSFRYS